jgi:hypothetical protein
MIGRFISADTIVQSAPLPIGQPIGSLITSYSQTKWLYALNRTSGRNYNVLTLTTNPQELNRYSHSLNNPLRYIDPQGNQAEVGLFQLISSYIETIFGLGGGAYSAHSYSNEANNEIINNAINNALDNARKKISKVMVWAKSLFEGEATTGNPNPERGPKPPNGNLRDRLKQYTGYTDDQIRDMDAHHVFPQKFRNYLWNRYGLDIDDPQYGSWVKSNTHSEFSQDYNMEWQEFLTQDHTIDEILEFGKILANKYGFSVLY